jgi:imidazoleglycerol phosphate synthase glutamine amidotransferase subunit HisH
MTSLEQAARFAESMHDARLGVFVEVYRARGRLQRGAELDVDTPARAADRAEELGMPGVGVLARTMAARTALVLGQTDRALQLSSRAMEVRDELGGVEEDEAEVYLVHAYALEAAGQSERAHAVREQGKARLSEVASRIADATWRTRFLHDVQAHRELMQY